MTSLEEYKSSNEWNSGGRTEGGMVGKGEDDEEEVEKVEKGGYHLNYK